MVCCRRHIPDIKIVVGDRKQRFRLLITFNSRDLDRCRRSIAEIKIVDDDGYQMSRLLLAIISSGLNSCC